MGHILARSLKASPSIVLMLIFSVDILCADDLNDNNRSKSSFKGAIGIGVVTKTRYEGSREYTQKAVPVLEMSYKSFFISPLRGIGISIPLSQEFEIAPSISIYSKRPEWEMEKRGETASFNDLRAAASISATYRYGRIASSAWVLKRLSADDGMLVGLKIGCMNTIGEQWMLNLSVSAEYADKKYNQALFGITPEQSGEYHFDIYEAKSGFKDIGINASISYRITKTLSISAVGGYKRLLDIAANSPIVKDGTADQYRVGIIMSHRI
ncbi:MAG: MipA/OmpV family protein [Helicobacteraceae bacterium]|nr:MipA/OmpV family protein [Helicobacteraceae bacterium]